MPSDSGGAPVGILEARRRDVDSSAGGGQRARRDASSPIPPKLDIAAERGVDVDQVQPVGALGLEGQGSLERRPINGFDSGQQIEAALGPASAVPG